MGMYARINAQLEDANKRKDELEATLKVACETKADEREIDEITYELANVYQSICELEGALLEMAEIDGYGPDEYDKWLDTFEGE